jgi:hypothetical protein
MNAAIVGRPPLKQRAEWKSRKPFFTSIERGGFSPAPQNRITVLKKQTKPR